MATLQGDQSGVDDLPGESRLSEDGLARIRATESPRISPQRIPMASRAIHAAVLLLWIALFAAPFGLHGVWVWSAGLIYITYDTLLLAFTFWKTLPLASRPSGASPDETLGPGPSVGVLVAAKNEALVLPVTLDALLGQSDPPDVIVVVDDGSTDDTPDVLGRLYGLATPPLGEVSGSGRIRWLRLAGGGKASSGRERRRARRRR